jgi:dihydroneopterin triphosphate diphosphatase
MPLLSHVSCLDVGGNQAGTGPSEGIKTVKGVNHSMARAPLQVLVLPFRRADSSIEYAIFRRTDHADDCWQGVAGGVEHGELAEQAARREMMEESGIPRDAPLVSLDAIASVPAFHFENSKLWGSEVYVVTERAFGVWVPDGLTITLSHEHCEYRWLPYDEAAKLLKWDSNRTALWELNERLCRGDWPTAR